MVDDAPLADLLARARIPGAQDAWDEIVARFGNLVWAVIRSHRLEDGLAEDASQTVWLRLVENLDRIREPERLRAWLVTTARHESLLAIRRSSREVPSAVIDEIEIVARDPPPIAGLLDDELHAALWRAYGGLPDRCQALLRLWVADPPATYAEIVELLAMPQGSIGPTLRRCLERLRAALEREGFDGIPTT